MSHGARMGQEKEIYWQHNCGLEYGELLSFKQASPLHYHKRFLLEKNREDCVSCGLVGTGVAMNPLMHTLYGGHTT